MKNTSKAVIDTALEVLSFTQEKLKSINLDNVCKCHGNKDILANVTFEARPGRVTAFLGHNGAVKSSAFRILLGLDYPITGTATFGRENCCFRFPVWQNIF